MATEPKTDLEFWPPGAMQPDLLFNALLLWVAAWAQATVLAFEDDPPVSPVDGDAYIVGTGTGDWSGHDTEQARWDDASGTWLFFVPLEGYEIRNMDDGSVYSFDGSAWQVAAGGLSDAPSDGNIYGRKDGDWEQIPGGGGAVDSVNGRTGAVTLSAADAPASVVVLSGTDYDMGDLTAGAWHVFTSGSAVTITIEDDATEPVPTDAEYGIEARGAGGVTLVEDNAATIIPPKGGTLALEEDDFAVLKRTAADEYKLVGSTVAA